MSQLWWWFITLCTLAMLILFVLIHAEFILCWLRPLSCCPDSSIIHVTPCPSVPKTLIWDLYYGCKKFTPRSSRQDGRQKDLPSHQRKMFFLYTTVRVEDFAKPRIYKLGALRNGALMRGWCGAQGYNARDSNHTLISPHLASSLGKKQMSAYICWQWHTGRNSVRPIHMSIGLHQEKCSVADNSGLSNYREYNFPHKHKIRMLTSMATSSLFM